MKYLLTLFLVIFTSLPAWAQEAAVDASKATVTATLEAPQEVGDVMGFLPVIIHAAQNGQWLLFGALIALVVTFIAKKYILPKLKLGNGLLPLISALVGMVGGVGLAIANGAEPLQASLAVLSGPLASTLWDALIKYFFKK